MSLRVVAGPIGAAVGFAIGGAAGAAWGWQIGATAGAILDPATVKGPSLGDIAQQTSQEGGPIPIVYGISAPLAGNVIACSQPKIQTVKSGGKGGPKVESEVVYRTYAVGICEGPIGGVLRVWRNNTKVYDVLDPEFTDPTETTALPAWLGGGSSSAPSRNEVFLEKARFFLGDYEQDASPDLEAIYGAGTTPAHRGLAYMVMADEDVTDVGGMVPQWLFQVGSVVGATEPQVGILSYYAGNAALLYDKQGNLLKRTTIPSESNRTLFRAPMQESNDYATYYSVTDTFANITVRKVKIYPNGDLDWGSSQTFPLESVSSLFASSNLFQKVGVMRAGYANYIIGVVRLDGTLGDNRHGIAWVDPETGSGGGLIIASGVSSARILPNVSRSTNVQAYFTEGNLYWGFQLRTIGLDSSVPSVFRINIFAEAGGTSVSPTIVPVGAPGAGATSALANMTCHLEGAATWMTPQIPTRIAKTYPDYVGPQLVPTDDITSIQCSPLNNVAILYVQHGAAPVGQRTLYYKLSPDGSTSLFYNPNDDIARGYIVLNDRVVFQHNRPGSSDPPYRYVSVDIDTGAVISDEIITQPFTDAQWGNGASMQAYEIIFPYYRDPVYRENWDTIQPSVAAIAEDLANRAGISAGMFDTSLIDPDVTTGGLVVTNQYPVYQAIQALGQVYRFDATKYDGKIRLVPRGANSVATITEDDMVSEDDAPIDANSKRSDAIAIPRVLNLSYYDVDSSGLTPIKQTSERSGDRRAVGDASMQSAVVMDANTASQAVHIAHAVMIEEQKGELRFALPDNWLKLVPTDPVIVQWQGKVERARLTQVEILDGYQRYIALRDRQSAYTSEVEGLPPPAIPNPNSRVAGPTVIIPLDVPIVQDQDDSVGLSYYVAVCGLTTGWTGATVELSYDGGANYVQSKSAGIPAVIGVLKSPLPSHPADYPDYTNEFEVELFSPGAELETTDLAGMMNRFNLAAVGNLDDGWELINFSSAVEDDPETRHWTLSGLLRGRRGTAPRSHSADDVIVLMDRGLVAMEAAEVSNIGQALTFRATSNGETTDTGTVVSMEYEGWGQKERKPAYLEAEKDGDNLVVSFQGVGRLGGGASATHGAYFTDYRVTLTDAASTVQQQNVDTVPFNISAGGLVFPVTLRVEQMNELTGAGEYVEAVARDDSIPLTEGAVDIVFGGSPTERDAVYVNIQYLRTASSVMKNFSQVIDASDFSPNDSPEDFADALHAELTAFFSGEPVSITMPSPDTVRIAPSVAFLFLVYEPELVRPRGVLDILQEPLPVQVGVKQVVALDLYQSVGGTWIPAPDPSNAYKTGGGGQFNFTIKGLTWGKKGRRPGAEMWPTQDQQYHGEIFTVPNNIWTSPGYSMSDVVTRFSSASLLNMAYFDDVTIAVVGSRNVVQITMKDGWEIPDNYILGVSTGSAFGLSPGSHPSGYRPGIKQVTAGVPAFPSGAKKSVSVRFSNISVTTSSGSVWSSFMPGDDIVVDLDGTPCAHTVSSDEADAFNKLGTLDSADIGFRNDVYESLKTSIEASGDFDVYLDAYENGLYAGLRIERNVVNTDFALSVTSTGFGLTVMKAEV